MRTLYKSGGTAQHNDNVSVFKRRIDDEHSGGEPGNCPDEKK
jgi:hypothetical protein